MFEAALITAFVIQRAIPVVIATEVTACTLIEFTDLVLDAYAMGKTAVTGELPEGPGELDIFFDLAEKWCSTLFIPGKG
jgi:hypothetical protein